MLKNFLAALLVGVLSCWNCFAQASPAANENINAREDGGGAARFSRAYFYQTESPKFDLEKDSLKTQTKKNNFSGGARTALIVGLFAAGVITVVFLATREKKENVNLPCGVGISQVGVQCPPGCACIQ